MVKRKSGFDREEKKERAREVVRKVSRRTNLDDMDPVVRAGDLMISKGSEVFFERTKGSKPFVCVGVVVSIYGNGGVDVWDETNNEFFLFNWRKLDSTSVKVRMQRSSRDVVETAIDLSKSDRSETWSELVKHERDEQRSFIDDVRDELTEAGVVLSSEMFEREILDVAACSTTIDDARIELERIEGLLGARYGLRTNVHALLLEMARAGQLPEDELVADWHDAMASHRDSQENEP